MPFVKESDVMIKGGSYKQEVLFMGDTKKSSVWDLAKERQTKFQKTRAIMYSKEQYEEAGLLKKAWYNTNSYFSLKMAEISEAWPEFRDSIKMKAFDIKWRYRNSALRDAVDKAGSKIKKGAVIVKDVTVLGATTAAKYISFGARKVAEGAIKFKNSELVQTAVKKTGGFFKAAGGWIKKQSVNVASKIKGVFSGSSKNVDEKNSKFGLLKREAAELFVRGWRGVKKTTVDIAKQTADIAKDMADKFSRTEFAKKTAEIAVKAGEKAKDAGVATGRGFKYLAKKIASGAKWTYGKVAPTVKSLAEKVANKFGELKARFSDWRYESSKISNGDNNDIHRMLREDKYGEDYTNRLQRFREDIKKNKDIMKRLNLRKDVERLNRNADDMEKGNTGDIELQDINPETNKPFEGEREFQGMLETINELDLGSAYIRREEPEIENGVPESLQKNGSAPKRERVSLDEFEQEVKDEELLKEKGVDINNIPKSAGDNKLVANGPKNAIKTAEKFNDLKKDDNSKKNVLKGKSKDEKLKNIVSKSTTALETTLKVAGKEFPLTNLSEAFSSAVDIKDPEKREKSITTLITNVLDEVGKIYKQFGGENSFSKIAEALNKNANGLILPKKDQVQIAKVQACLKNIQKGSNVLSTIVKEAGGNAAALNSTALLGPVITILKGVENYHKLVEKNEKLNALTNEDKSLNLVDNNVIRHINMAQKDLVNQNEVKQKQTVMNTAVNATLDTVGILTGQTAVTGMITSALSKVSPTDLIVASMKKKTDHQLMMTDAFGSMEKYREYKHAHGLKKEDVQREIMGMSSTTSVKEYANRVRMETALHLHSRAKQAQKYGIENGATKLRDAGGLESKTSRELYKEIGGEDFDKTLRRSKLSIFKEKLRAEKKKKEELAKNKKAENALKGKDINGKSDKDRNKKGISM